MWGAAVTDQKVLKTLPNSSSEKPTCIGGFVGRERYVSSLTWDVQGLRGEIVARVSQTPRLLQHKMLRMSVAALSALNAFSEKEWFEMLQTAASRLTNKTSESSCATLKSFQYPALISSTTGLPETRIRHALSTLADDLSRMRGVLEAQIDAPGQRSTREKRNWAYAPAGRHVAIRIPGNFPTINITWLMALAMRRPVLLCASLQDPLTPLLLVETLYDAGLPDGSISLGFGESAAFWKLADQLLWPGDFTFPLSGDSRRIKHYHQGRSKAIVLDRSTACANLWGRLANMAVRGCGRLCTNLSTVLVESDARKAAIALAEALAAYPILPLQHPRAIVPAFVDPEVTRQVALSVDEAKARGAIDVTELVTGMPLLQQHEGLHFLRPTVLQIDALDPLFGAEFAFPFVTVTESPRSTLIQLCRESLIVSVVGEDRALCLDLFHEPSISKVFHGDHFDRDYDPCDPHQGYLADFLFQKKAISPNFL